MKVYLKHSCSCYCERQSKVVLLMCPSCADSYAIAISTSDFDLFSYYLPSEVVFMTF